MCCRVPVYVHIFLCLSYSIDLLARHVRVPRALIQFCVPSMVSLCTLCAHVFLCMSRYRNVMHPSGVDGDEVGVNVW